MCFQRSNDGQSLRKCKTTKIDNICVWFVLGCIVGFLREGEGGHFVCNNKLVCGGAVAPSFQIFWGYFVGWAWEMDWNPNEREVLLFLYMGWGADPVLKIA